MSPSSPRRKSVKIMTQLGNSQTTNNSCSGILNDVFVFAGLYLQRRRVAVAHERFLIAGKNNGNDRCKFA
jgi:hypothetical protein